MLTKNQVMYIKNKGSIAGPMLKIPFMGPFIQALHPKFDEYLKQFASGPLSCVSVFHKYVYQALSPMVSVINSAPDLSC
jgi:C-22 sterol desaturase